MRLIQSMKIINPIKLFLLVSLCLFSVFGSTLIDPKLPKFPEHIEQCIDGHLYRAFVNEHRQVIPTSIHQVFVKSSLHGKMFPQTCTNDFDDKKISEK